MAFEDKVAIDSREKRDRLTPRPRFFVLWVTECIFDVLQHIRIPARHFETNILVVGDVPQPGSRKRVHTGIVIMIYE